MVIFLYIRMNELGDSSLVPLSLLEVLGATHSSKALMREGEQGRKRHRMEVRGQRSDPLRCHADCPPLELPQHTENTRHCTSLTLSGFK